MRNQIELSAKHIANQNELNFYISYFIELPTVECVSGALTIVNYNMHLR